LFHNLGLYLRDTLKDKDVTPRFTHESTTSVMHLAVSGKHDPFSIQRNKLLNTRYRGALTYFRK